MITLLLKRHSGGNQRMIEWRWKIKPSLLLSLLSFYLSCSGWIRGCMDESKWQRTFVAESEEQSKVKEGGLNGERTKRVGGGIYYDEVRVYSIR